MTGESYRPLSFLTPFKMLEDEISHSLLKSRLRPPVQPSGTGKAGKGDLELDFRDTRLSVFFPGTFYYRLGKKEENGRRVFANAVPLALPMACDHKELVNSLEAPSDYTPAISG